MPRSIISFGFEDSFKDGFEIGTTFRGLSDITSHIETFFLARTEVEAEVEIRVLLAIEIFRIVEKAGVGVGAGAGIGIETGIAIGVFKVEAFSSYAWLNKDST
jgi:hypothetical protein